MDPLTGPVEQKIDQNPDFYHLITLHPSPNAADVTQMYNLDDSPANNIEIYPWM